MNIPKWTSNGLMPCPSCGTKESLSNGLARNVMIARKKVRTSAMIPVLNGAVCFSFLARFRTATTETSENDNAMNNNEPALPA